MNRLQRRAWLRAAAGVCLAPLVLAGCARDSAEERLRRRISEMSGAIGERKVAAFMSGVAPDFIARGGLDHDGARQFLRLQLLRNASIGVTLGPLTVQLRGAEADATFKVMVTGSDGAWLPNDIQGWTVRSGWRDGEDGWQVVEADWEAIF